MIDQSHPLVSIEPRLRDLLPAMLYASAWLDPRPAMLLQVYDHLHTLRRMLQDYVPRFVADAPPDLGSTRYRWKHGTLMFTDLAGFTTLMEASAREGTAGAQTLLHLLNRYFASMVEIISKSNGNLLEWTGDAMLVEFPDDGQRNHTAQAIRAGLRMQRAMTNFDTLETPNGMISFGMRIGLHSGQFMAADIGTPFRMEYVLLGDAVQKTKAAESAGNIGRVCLSDEAVARVADDFRYETTHDGYVLVCDDLDDKELGEYDITPTRRRQATAVLLDRSEAGIISEIEKMLTQTEQLAAFLPLSVLRLLIESASQRNIPPQFIQLPVLYANLSGITEVADGLLPDEEKQLLSCFSRLFALINASVETNGGILKSVTYDRAGSNVLIYFGVTGSHTDDVRRAARTALAIRSIVSQTPPLEFSSATVTVNCKIGMAYGSAFAAEIGEPRGRREFNLLGDVVNTAARLMGKCQPNQLLLEGNFQRAIGDDFDCESLGEINLKGKLTPVPLYQLHDDQE